MHGLMKRVLFWDRRRRGVSMSAIGRELGVGRTTLYRWEALGEPAARAVAYGPRRRMPSLLDPYREWIAGRLAAYPKLSARRLFVEMREQGYSGGYDQVRRHVRRIRPVPAAEPVVRFETLPGVQGQVDFARAALPYGERQALVVVLGYSRLLWFQFYRSQKMEVLMRGLEEAFAYFGGVPRELLFDQMKAVVVADRREQGGGVLRNRNFLLFSRHWGFRIRVCRPYRARTKGKVERPIRYLRESFLYGREFASDADLNRQALRWLEREANVRVHGTLKERPVDRWEREKVLLGPLAPEAFDYERWVRREGRPPDAGAKSKQEGAERRSAVAVERRPLSEYGRLSRGVA